MRITFTFISLGILLGISSLALVANAQEETPPETTTTPREAATERRTEAATALQERRETRTEAKTERRAAFSVRTQERITNLAANTSNRVEAALNRLTQIADRLETRANLLAEQGVGTAAAGAKLAEARAELEQVMLLIDGIDATVADMIGSEEPYKAWQPVRETFLDAKKHLITAHAAMIEAVALLKEAVVVAELERGVSQAATDDTDTRDDTETETTE